MDLIRNQQETLRKFYKIIDRSSKKIRKNSRKNFTVGKRKKIALKQHFDRIQHELREYL